MDYPIKRSPGWIESSGILVQNPSDNSNWVIHNSEGKGLILGSHLYTDEKLKPVHLDKILTYKPDLFVSLVEEHELIKHGDFRPYVDKSATIVWFPIEDGGIGKDSEIIKLVKEILLYVRDNKLCYVACWGGHGRSGVISCLVLAAYFGLHIEIAIKLNKDLHKSRIYHGHKPTPQGVKQYAQIRRLYSQIK